MPRAKRKPTKSIVKKDRTYYQIGKRSASLSIRTRHDAQNPLQYVDDDGIPRSLRYCTNQESIFMDEQQGDVILGRVTMFDGVLRVPKENQVLQNFLEHHPHNGVLFEEFDPEVQAEEELSREEQLFKAKSYIFNSKPEDAKAVAQVIKGSSVLKDSDKVITQNLLSTANSDPEMIIELFEDEDLKFLVIASQALDAGILTVKGGKLMNKGTTITEIGFSQEPREVLKEYLKTPDGDKLKKYLLTQLK